MIEQNIHCSLDQLLRDDMDNTRVTHGAVVPTEVFDVLVYREKSVCVSMDVCRLTPHYFRSVGLRCGWSILLTSLFRLG